MSQKGVRADAANARPVLTLNPSDDCVELEPCRGLRNRIWQSELTLNSS